MSHADRPDPDTITLDDGSAAATADEVLAALESMGVEHQTQIHHALYTVEDAKRVTYAEPGAHTKNLFLRNKKGRMFLVVLEQDRVLDLKALRELLVAPGGQLAFASTDRMLRYLGVVPGSVTPLAALNDKGRAVRIVIDSVLLDQEWIWLHPCRNTHSTRIRTRDLMRVLEAWHQPAEVLHFD